MKRRTSILIALVILALVAMPVLAQPDFQKGQNGTTLAGYKTLDICRVTDTTWRYSGVIAVWNEGAIDTEGLTITDIIEYKVGNKFQKLVDVPVVYSGEIPAGTTQLTALTFPYSIDASRIDSLTIRNSALITITNHSGNLGKPFGPNPKVTYSGTFPPPDCEQDMGCTLTQGYWGNKPDVSWPEPYKRDAVFFLSGKTWQEVFDTPVNASQGYYQLAHQYMAAVLNQANGAYVPQGVQDTLNLATAWLDSNSPAACAGKASSCGTQKDWAAVLDLYNNGLYPGGPSHCE